MAEPTEQSQRGGLLRSITFQFLLFVAIVVAYNRIVFALHTPSAHRDFSNLAAPLYAFTQPIPAISGMVLIRWAAPIAVAMAWIGLSKRWIGKARTPARLATMTGTMVWIALGFVLILNLATAMMDDGVRSIGWPFSRTGEEYFGDAIRVHDPLAFLRDYPTLHLSRHPRTHPPGAVMFLWTVRRVIGGELLTGSLAAIVVTALTILPAAALARRMLPERGAAIFIALYALTPNLVLLGATSMDGVFACLLVTTAYVFFAAADGDGSWPGIVLRGVHLGAWLALSTFFTFASVAMVVLFVVWWSVQCMVDPGRSARTFALLAIAAITMVAGFAALYALTGCNMIACLRASIAFDADKMRPVRTAYLDTSVTNLLGFLVGSGLIASTLWMRSVGESRRLKPARRGDAGRIAVALAITIVGLSGSTLFTRELERIWMFFTPLLLIGAASALDRIEPEPLRRRWIVAAMILLFAQTWVTQLFLNTVW